jgi:hypothetical protein
MTSRGRPDCRKFGKKVLHHELRGVLAERKRLLDAKDGVDDVESIRHYAGRGNRWYEGRNASMTCFPIEVVGPSMRRYIPMSDSLEVRLQADAPSLEVPHTASDVPVQVAHASERRAPG